MYPWIRAMFGCLAVVASGAATAREPRDAAGNPMTAIKDNRWADAQAATARFADPVTGKLVLYYRLLAPGAATATEIADFMARNPDWPAQALLERRRQEAITADPDQADVLAQCTAAPPTLAATLLRCAEALANAGRNADATATARRAWTDAVTDPGLEATFLRRWPDLPNLNDQWDRFRRLGWHEPAGAARQLARLAPRDRTVADAWLAFKRDDPKAEALWSALAVSRREEPGLVLDRARSLRRTSHLPEAVALWNGAASEAHRAAPAHRNDFWTERNLLARKLLEAGDPVAAYGLTAAHGDLDTEQRLDAEFLAGFIALRRLKDPGRARPHFQSLADASRSAITQGRANYWLALTQSAAGRDPTASFRRAANWATTFYGQLAAIASGDSAAALARRIAALRDPPYTADTTLGFAGHQVVRAALWLVAWGEPRRAHVFLLRMDELAPIPAERTLTADLALQLGLPDTAVFVARRVGRDGGMLPQAGWPIPYTPPAPLDPAIALGIMRQESSFDVGAISPSGARGLMQLMPATAQAVARKLAIPTSLAGLTADPAHNMQLGTAYLLEMLARFDNSLPLAIAAYNAGPSRVEQWLQDNGDPRTGAASMIDWLELIPIAETRNYVQRVLENIVIYRARRNDSTPTLPVQWTR